MAPPLPRRDYRTLDAIVVCAGLALVGAVGWALVFRAIPEANLPILASLGTGVLGIIVTYVNARWGNKKPTTDEEPPQPVVVKNPPEDPAQVEDAAR